METEKPKIFEISPDYLSRNKSLMQAGDMPRQDIPDAEKTPDWYLKNTWFISQFYNRPIMPVLAGGFDRFSTNDNRGDTSFYPVWEMYKYFEYATGRQHNIDFSVVEKNYTSSNMHAIYIPGKDVAQITDNLTGVIRANTANASWSCKTFSPDLSKKMKVVQSISKLQKLHPEKFEALKENGIMFPEIKDEDIEKEMDKNAVKVSKMANSIWWRNEMAADVVRNGNNLIVAGIACLDNIVLDGKNIPEIFPPTHAIIDNRYDDDYNRKAQFWGRIETMTPNQVLARWKHIFSPEQRSDLSLMAGNANMTQPYNIGMSNLLWWGGINYNLVTTIKYYWRGCNEDGSDDNIIYTGTLIGNRWLVDFGVATNTVEGKAPIQYFLHNMRGGWVTSVTQKMCQIQSEIDMLRMQIRKMIGEAKGKKFFVKGWMFGGDMDMEEIFRDFSTVGLHVLEHEGELKYPENNDNNPIIPVDLSSDVPLMQRLMELISLRKQDMKEAVNVSDLFLGQQQEYIGQQALNTSLSQNSLGLKYMIDGYFDFIQQCMQYGVDRQRLLNHYNGVKEFEVESPADGMTVIDFDDDEPLQKVGLKLRINDTVDAKGMQDVLDLLKVASQNPQQTGVYWDDVVRARKSQTWAEIELYANECKKRFEDATTEAQKVQQDIAAQTNMSQEAMMIISKVASHLEKLELQSLKNEGALEAAAAKSEQGLSVELLKRLFEEHFAQLAASGGTANQVTQSMLPKQEA